LWWAVSAVFVVRLTELLSMVEIRIISTCKTGYARDSLVHLWAPLFGPLAVFVIIPAT